MRILDTDVIVEVLRGNARVREAQGLSEGIIATTVISVAELCYGAAKATHSDREYAAIDEFLLSVVVLDVSVEAARVFGETKAALERAGRRLPDADLLIAAICLARRATLVTGNGRHFARISSLATEDWIRA